MPFTLPEYTPPDFTSDSFASARVAKTVPAPEDGVAPDNFHGTSNHPEYVHLKPNTWVLASESRMDCVLVVKGGSIDVVEPRRLKKGDQVVVGRSENGEDGVLLHTNGFDAGISSPENKFAFGTRGTRETPFSRSYDQLYDLLRYERDHGYIVWVLGPAVAFDWDSRKAMSGLIQNGFCHALMAGNALATHDLEAAHFRTGLGVDIYSQAVMPDGHYNHLDVLNVIRSCGSIPSSFGKLGIKDGIIHACEKNQVPYVLAGSIRDDGPLPEVILNSGEAQDTMRVHARKATTVITLATQLHSIAFGNITPSYHVINKSAIRPVYFYIVDMTEFSADKLANRGSGQAIPILTNAQDFMINLWNNLAVTFSDDKTHTSPDKPE